MANTRAAEPILEAVHIDNKALDNVKRSIFKLVECCRVIMRLVGNVLFLVIYSKQPMFGFTHEWFREFSFPRLECGVHDRLIRAPAHLSAVWDILLPLEYTP